MTASPGTFTKAISAQNQFTAACQLDRGQSAAVSIRGATFTATLTIQRSFDGGATWNDVTTEAGAALSFTAKAEVNYTAVVPMDIRVGVKTGGFTSQTDLVAEIRR